MMKFAFPVPMRLPFLQQGEGRLGLTLKKRDNYFEFASVAPGSSSAEAGVLQGDILLCVDECPVINWPLDMVVSMLRGEPGTWVRLTLQRHTWGGKTQFDVMIQRQAFSSQMSPIWRLHMVNTLGHLFSEFVPGPRPLGAPRRRKHAHNPHALSRCDPGQWSRAAGGGCSKGHRCSSGGKRHDPLPWQPDRPAARVLEQYEPRARVQQRRTTSTRNDKPASALVQRERASERCQHASWLTSLSAANTFRPCDSTCNCPTVACRTRSAHGAAASRTLGLDESAAAGRPGRPVQPRQHLLPQLHRPGVATPEPSTLPYTQNPMY